MSNNMIQQRKNEVMVLLKNKEIQERLCALCGNEASKYQVKINSKQVCQTLHFMLFCVLINL